MSKFSLWIAITFLFAINSYGETVTGEQDEFQKPARGVLQKEAGLDCKKYKIIVHKKIVDKNTFATIETLAKELSEITSPKLTKEEMKDFITRALCYNDSHDYPEASMYLYAVYSSNERSKTLFREVINGMNDKIRDKINSELQLEKDEKFFGNDPAKKSSDPKSSKSGL